MIRSNFSGVLAALLTVPGPGVPLAGGREAPPTIDPDQLKGKAKARYTPITRCECGRPISANKQLCKACAERQEGPGSK